MTESEKIRTARDSAVLYAATEYLAAVKHQRDTAEIDQRAKDAVEACLGRLRSLGAA